MALAAVAVAVAASYPTLAAVVATVVGAALQRRYGKRVEKRIGVTAANRS